jgi:hypothetical protein
VSVDRRHKRGHRKRAFYWRAKGEQMNKQIMLFVMFVLKIVFSVFCKILIVLYTCEPLVVLFVCCLLCYCLLYISHHHTTAKVSGNFLEWTCEGQINRDANGQVIWNNTFQTTVSPPWKTAGKKKFVFFCFWLYFILL